MSYHISQHRTVLDIARSCLNYPFFIAVSEKRTFTSVLL